MILRHDVDVLEETWENTPLGRVSTWTTRETIPCLVKLESLEGRGKFEQLGYSEVKRTVVFRGPVNLSIKDRLLFEGQLLEIIEPPGNPDGVNRFVTVSVREIEESSS